MKNDKWLLQISNIKNSDYMLVVGRKNVFSNLKTL